jgi:hypothetical protein
MHDHAAAPDHPRFGASWSAQQQVDRVAGSLALAHGFRRPTPLQLAPHIADPQCQAVPVCSLQHCISAAARSANAAVHSLGTPRQHWPHMAAVHMDGPAAHRANTARSPCRPGNLTTAAATAAATVCAAAAAAAAAAPCRRRRQSRMLPCSTLRSVLLQCAPCGSSGAMAIVLSC